MNLTDANAALRAKLDAALEACAAYRAALETARGPLGIGDLELDEVLRSKGMPR